MKRTFKSIIRSIAQLVTSESGEMLSTRRKEELLHEMFSQSGRHSEKASARRSSTL